LLIFGQLINNGRSAEIFFCFFVLCEDKFPQCMKGVV